MCDRGAIRDRFDMTDMPDDLRELQRRLKETDMGCVPSGTRDLSTEVYPAVKDEHGHLIDDSVRCSDICSGGSNSPEWQHRVRTVLHSSADDPGSRVHKRDQYGEWHFD